MDASRVVRGEAHHTWKQESTFYQNVWKKKKERGKEEKRKEKTAIPESRVRVVFDVFLRN